MKTLLVVAAVLGLSATGALADCIGHTRTTASADIDRTMTTASIVTEKSDLKDGTVLKTGRAAGTETETPAAIE
ncbi:hypothetical protein DEM27_12630 [Metarhizobium album]|uniref:Uncharacterized protein n=1 Tax=Metarhizobium album TaxID=2182425 RepID=A0A2U2DSG6_9HYPH|nr:hypothetical protein [Rhizobium album]PWE56260.1 hypothetical protein DEM27_12630 [Rhizobium album]